MTAGGNVFYKVTPALTNTFTINPDKDLSFPNKKGEQILENGYFTVMTGALKARFKLTDVKSNL